jgi:D-glycero-D-manno-heptose 1,7-bisphosphate phosphatase
VKRALFLDRDGVLNRLRPGDYVKSPAELELLPGVADAVKALQGAGFFTVLVSNQQGVGKGLLTQEDLDAVTDALRAKVPLDAVYYCPHLQSEGCACRKPKPGLIRLAVTEHQLDVARSVMVGDSYSDLQAARTAGVGLFVRVGDGNPWPDAPDYHASDLSGALRRLLPQDDED